MDQDNAALRLKINTENGITEKKDLYQENYYSLSSNSENDSSDSQDYQIIQPSDNK
jgi:hypothetical protein